MKSKLLPVILVMVLWIAGCTGNTENSASAANGQLISTSDEGDTGNAAANSGSGSPIHMNKAMFLEKVYNYEKNPNDWVFEGDKPCIIDFYADWCKPCKMVAPIMADLAAKYDGQITVYKINTDEEKELAQYFGIRSIPTLLFCPMNEKPQMTQGALPKEDFEKIVKEVLLKK